MSERQSSFSQARPLPSPAATAHPASGAGDLQGSASRAEGENPAGSRPGDRLDPGAGQHEWLSAEAEEVAIESLVVSDTPRLSGESLEHVQTLAATQSRLPPIIVHRQTMQVIDGMHRIRAAKLKGQESITVQFFEGSDADAFVLAVKANVSHGLPLPLADRKAAVARIIESHPHWADRMIAQVTGLAARTVAEIRKRSREPGQAGTRLGRDGRFRPVNSSTGRVVAAELFISNPQLSLRQVARQAGISPETARDVRHRLRNGENPVPDRPRARPRGTGDRESGGGRPRAGLGAGPKGGRISREGRVAVIERLRADPALRFSEKGRSLLRLLHLHTMKDEELDRIAESVPAHLRTTVAFLARECARLWTELADRVEQKGPDGAVTPVRAAAERSPR
ncbi:MAG TPA: ParB N-terminal domain-containing protein [Streptosporangiaceae bacterium]